MMLLNPVKLSLQPTLQAHQHTAHSTQHTIHKPRDTATQLQLTCIWFHVQKSISPFKPYVLHTKESLYMILPYQTLPVL